MKSYSRAFFIFTFLYLGIFLSYAYSPRMYSMPQPTFNTSQIGGTTPQIPPMQQPSGLPPELTMSEEEWNQVFEYLSTLDEKQLKELEEYGRQVLTDVYGLDPDTLQPLPGGPKNPSQVPSAHHITPPVIEKKEPERPVAIENRKEVSGLIKNLITKLTSIRTKLTLLPPYEVPSFTWLNQLNALIVYLSVLDKNEHYERLLLPEFSSLLEALKQLSKVVNMYEPLLAIEDISECENICASDDPYEILGISSRASTQEIEEKFHKISQVKNPEIIKQNLQEAQKRKQISQKDVSRALKEALLNFSIIQDAYEKLKDPKIRQYIDRERLALQGQSEQTHFNIQQALSYIDQSLTKAFIQGNILNQIETFLKKYEPQELARKKELIEAQTKRYTEQETLSKLKPSLTPGGPYEKHIQRPLYENPFTNLGYGNQLPSYVPTQPHYEPSLTTPKETPEKPSSETSVQKEKDKGEKKAAKAEELEKTKEKEDKKAKTTKKKIRAQTEKYKEKTTALLKELEKECSHLQEYVTKPQNKNIFSSLDAFLHDQTPQKKYPKKVLPPLVSPISQEVLETKKEEKEEISPEEISTEPQKQTTEESTSEISSLTNLQAPEESLTVEPISQIEQLPQEQKAIENENLKIVENQQTIQILTQELENKEKELEKFLKENNLLKFDEDLIKLKEMVSKKDVTSTQKQETLQKWYPLYMKCQPHIKQLEIQFKEIMAPFGKNRKALNQTKEKFLSGNSIRPGLLRIASNAIDRISKTIEEIDKILRKQT